jgi:ABC-type proline/glycine betaine transport system permease subunit
MDAWKEWFDWFALGDWAETFISWLQSVFGPVFTFIRDVLLGAYTQLFDLLNLPPSLVMIALLALAGGLARSWLFALGAVVSLLLIDLMGQWQNAMQTLALVIVCVAAAAALAIPIGIAAARSGVISNLIKPVLDLMQTMPPLVYLIPGVIIFGVGVVPGIVATIVFAMPPGIRLTELGIRQVDKEVVEAGHAFGSSHGKILRQIQLPLALPTIMAGINQVIMLALSMVVLAGFVGAPGLGQQVLSAISRLNVGLGVEAGLSVVILAIYLDRVTAALGARSTVARLERAA